MNDRNKLSTGIVWCSEPLESINPSQPNEFEVESE